MKKDSVFDVDTRSDVGELSGTELPVLICCLGSSDGYFVQLEPAERSLGPISIRGERFSSISSRFSHRIFLGLSHSRRFQENVFLGNRVQRADDRSEMRTSRLVTVPNVWGKREQHALCIVTWSGQKTRARSHTSSPPAFVVVVVAICYGDATV